MKYAPMRFDGMSLRHNPAQLSISGKSRIKEYASPCIRADSTSLGAELRRISGEGELSGRDCIAQYQALEQRQQSQKRAKLILPHLQPLYAYLRELAVTAKPTDDVLYYRFVFIEAQSPRGSLPRCAYYVTAVQGESLWDISYAYSVPVERLTALNPQIPYIDDLNRGERVRVC